MKVFMIIFIIMVVLVELFIVAGCFTTMKYQIEMATNVSEILEQVYSMLNTLSLIIIFDLFYLCVMYVLYFKK